MCHRYKYERLSKELDQGLGAGSSGAYFMQCFPGTRCQACDQEKTGIELPDVRMYSRVFTKVLPTFNDVMQHVYVINDSPENLQQESI